MAKKPTSKRYKNSAGGTTAGFMPPLPELNVTIGAALQTMSGYTASHHVHTEHGIDNLRVNPSNVPAGRESETNENPRSGTITLKGFVGSLEPNFEPQARDTDVYNEARKWAFSASTPDEILLHEIREFEKILPVEIDASRNLAEKISIVLQKHGISEDVSKQICLEIACLVEFERGCNSPQPKDLISLPKIAPELWVNRNIKSGEAPDQFINRVYGQDQGLHTGVIQQLDKALSVAYDRHLKAVAKGKAMLQPGHPLPNSDQWKKSRPKLTPEQRAQAKAEEWQEYRERQNGRST